MQQNQCSWPGVSGITSASYTCSHGLSPGTGTVTCVVPPAADAVADFTIGDTENTLTLKNCRVTDVQFDLSGGGQTWTFRFQDRRWKWDEGLFSATFNQLDTRGKLVPETIYSPTEMIEMVLKEMGEKDYEIKAPDGLKHADYADKEDLFKAGENAPPSFTNAPFQFDAVTPAGALGQLADFYALRVVYDPVGDRVLVVPPGRGADLPDGFRESVAASLKVPALPAGVGVVGAFVKFQVRLPFEPVALEWEDGLYVPLDKASYAPRAGQAGRERPWDFTPPGTNGDAIPTDRLSYAEAVERASQSVFRCYRLTSTGLDRKGPLKIPGYDGEIKRRRQVRLLPTKVEQVKPAYSNPNVVGSGGQTYMPASEFYNGYSRDQQAYAYGSVLNAIQDGVYKGNRSENTPAGSRINLAVAVDDVNQLAVFDRPVYARKDVGGRTAARPVSLVIETGVNVADKDTGAVYRFMAWKAADGKGKIQCNLTDKVPDNVKEYQWFLHPGVRCDVVNTYAYDAGADLHKLTGTTYPDKDTALTELEYYFTGHLDAFRISGGQTNTYIGCRLIRPDGAVMQVTWSIGPGGPTTVASRNSEHAKFLPDYPARRNDEALAPDPVGSLQKRMTFNGDYYSGASRMAAQIAINQAIKK